MIKKQAIKDLACRYRPREKVRDKGIQALNNYELLALIIGSGRKNCNVLELAKKVEKQLFSTTNNKIDQPSLTKIFGIGEILANKILASLELGQRLIQKPNCENINTPAKIFELSRELHTKKQEHCLAFYLNGRQELIGKKTIAVGGLNFNFLEPRYIFEPAFHLGANSFILVHNHPSGNPQPSDNDLLLTKKIANIADLMGIKLLDHLIVCKNDFFSIREHFVELVNVEAEL